MKLLFKKVTLLLGIAFSFTSLAMYPFESPYLNLNNMDILKNAIENGKTKVNLIMEDNKTWEAQVIKTLNNVQQITETLKLLPINYYGNVEFFVNALDQRGDFKNTQFVTQYTGYFMSSQSVANKEAIYYVLPTQIKKESNDDFKTKLAKIIVVKMNPKKK